jgi:hypothetical protein
LIPELKILIFPILSAHKKKLLGRDGFSKKRRSMTKKDQTHENIAVCEILQPKFMMSKDFTPILCFVSKQKKLCVLSHRKSHRSKPVSMPSVNNQHEMYM